MCSYLSSAGTGLAAFARDEASAASSSPAVIRRVRRLVAGVA